MKVNEILLGDCVEVMKEFPDESVDLIFADPPYNLGKDFGNGTNKFKTQDYLEFTTRWLDECVRLLKPNGSIYVCMGVRFIAHLYMLMDERLLFNGWITWHYTQGMGRVRGFSPRHEDILYFVKVIWCLTRSWAAERLVKWQTTWGGGGLELRLTPSSSKWHDAESQIGNCLSFGTALMKESYASLSVRAS